MRDISLKMEAFVLLLLSSKGVAWTMFIAGMTLLVAWLYPETIMSFIPGFIFLGIALGIAVNRMEKFRLFTGNEDVLLDGNSEGQKIPLARQAVMALILIAVSCYFILFPYTGALELSPLDLDNETFVECSSDALLFIAMVYVEFMGICGIVAFNVARGRFFADENIVAVRRVGIGLALIFAIVTAGYSLLLFMNNNAYAVIQMVSVFNFVALATARMKFAAMCKRGRNALFQNIMHRIRQKR